MSKLKYILDSFSVDENKLTYLGKDSRDAVHKVLIVGKGIALHGYAAPTGHVRIARNHKLNGNILGGFNFYLDKDETLVFDGRSSFYGGVPRSIADQFAKLIHKELKKKGIKTKGVTVDPIVELKPRWNQYGFYEEEEKGLVSRVNTRR